MFRALLTRAKFMRTVTMVDPQWLADLGGKFFSVKKASFEEREKERAKLKQLTDEMHAEAEHVVPRVMPRYAHLAGEHLFTRARTQCGTS